MELKFCTKVKENDDLRASFNELTRKTFYFDFEGWYNAGHWGDLYIPHAMLDGNKVVSNVSVNIIKFDIDGVEKNYIQLGTVMTDEAYRGQGLNAKIMEEIFKEYKDKVDGIYLFGNDGVLDYYPKFGFKPAKEFEYYISCNNNDATPYEVIDVDMGNEVQADKVYEKICAYTKGTNKNDGMYMSENFGLYQFWLAAEFDENVYYLPETDSYVIVYVEGNTLVVVQIIGEKKIDLNRLAKSFGEEIKEVVLGYTPIDKGEFEVREHKEEDSTLFIWGEDLQRIEKDKLMFPIMSHA